MTDYHDGDDSRDESDQGVEEEPPIYRSGRVRIIGAEPAGDAVHEATGPVDDTHFDMPHWNDAPTGQVPAILDRGTGEEPGLAPPTWREEATDWAAHEELFEPAMLSDDQPAVGALHNEDDGRIDVEREPWRFDSNLGDDTLVAEPDYPREPEHPTIAIPILDADFAPPVAAGSAPARRRVPIVDPLSDMGLDLEPADAHEAEPEPVAAAPAPRRRAVARRTELADASAAAASRLTPPGPPKVRAPRTPRTSRVADGARNPRNPAGGTAGRDMKVAVGVGVGFAAIGLICFKEGPLPAMVLVTLVVLLAVAEAFAAFRRAQYHPATLLGLVAVLSLMFETYNKGVSALPLVLVLLVAGCFVWFLAKVEAGADPVAGMVSTVFVFGWVGGFGSFAALLLNPTLFPHRHGVAFLLAAIITTVAADVTALLVGSAMGNHLMAPSISPNKSWEGFIGGAVASVLAAVIFVHLIHPWSISKAAVLGLVVAVVAPLGDLSQSMIKRHLGLKDMGRLLPGHGGLLDRFDGLLFVLPATYFVVKALHLG
jgi:CDP-diglyceride synthetase